jgi:hypothetical protein
MYNFFKNLFIIFASFTISFVLLGSYILFTSIYVIAYFIRIIKKTIKTTTHATKSIF